MPDDTTVTRLEEQVRILGHAAGIEVTDPLTAIPPSSIELARGPDRLQAVRQLRRLGMSLTAANRAVDAASGASARGVPRRWYDREWLARVGMVVVFLCVGALLKYVL
jgi:hypothetical protein